MNHTDYMLMAIEQAKKSKQPLPCGCVLVGDNKILTKTYNTQRKDSDPTAHAEVKALRQAGVKWGREAIKGATAYCTCEPCAMCRAALVIAGVSKIYFGVSLKDLDSKSEEEAGVAKEELMREEVWGELYNRS